MTSTDRWPYPPRTRQQVLRTRIGVAAAACVVVAASAVVIARTGDDDATGAASATSDTSATTTTVAPFIDNNGSTATVPANVQENRDVQVTGDPLAELQHNGSLDPAIGHPMPQIDGSSFDGTPVSLKKGRATLIMVLAHWSTPSVASLGPLSQWWEGQHPDVDVVIVSTLVKSDKPNYPPSKLFPSTFPFPVLADSDDNAAATALGFNGVPFTLIVDADGIVRDRFNEPVDLGVLYVELPNALGLG